MAGLMQSQEVLFLEYVERLEHHRQGRQMVQFHLSKLKPFNRREHHIRVAANAFDGMIKNLQGQLFTLKNSDLIFIFKTEALGQVEEAVHKLRFLFGDDPLISDEMDDGGKFCSWHNVETDYSTILTLAREIAAKDRSAAGAAGALHDAKAALLAKEAEGEPLSPRVLGRVIDALKAADLTNMVRRQYVCRLVGPQGIPAPEFSELFISIKDLRETLLPGVNLASSPWLFQYLTETLDKRILAMLGKSEDRSISGAISVNLNVSTILASEFMQFDDNVIAGMRGKIVIELSKVDIFADLNAFLFAREYLRDRGYRICIDGLNHLTMPYVDRERLGADLVKLVWSTDLIRGEQSLKDQVKRQIMRCGEDRIILCRCDDQDAIDFGKSMGIELFQGRHVENLIAEENRRRNMRLAKRRKK